MYEKLVKPKNILKIMLTIIIVWLMSATLSATFSTYVDLPDYSDEDFYYIRSEDFYDIEFEDVSNEGIEEVNLEEFEEFSLDNESEEIEIIMIEELVLVTLNLNGVTFDNKIDYLNEIGVSIIEANRYFIIMNVPKGLTFGELGLAEIEKEGFVFDGWNTERYGSGRDIGGDVEIIEPMDVFAQWIIEVIGEFEDNGFASEIEDNGFASEIEDNEIVSEVEGNEIAPEVEDNDVLASFENDEDSSLDDGSIRIDLFNNNTRELQPLGMGRYHEAMYDDIAPAAFGIMPPTSWNAPPGGGRRTFNIPISDAWTARSNVNWMTARRTRDDLLEINVSANTGTDQRTGIVTIIGRGINRTITVRQAPSSQLTVSPTPWDAPPVGGWRTINVTSNIQWTVRSNNNWLTISNTTPANRTGNGSFRINAASNTGTGQRTGTVTVTGGGITRTITVRQAPRTPPVQTVNSWIALRDAINAAPANIQTTIQISGNFSAPTGANGNAITIPANRRITLVSNNATRRVLTQSIANRRHFTVNGSLILGNNITLSGGVINNRNSSGGVIVNGGGTLTLQNGSIVENIRRTATGGAIIAIGNGTAAATRANVVMRGGIIRNNTAASGSGVELRANSLFTMSGGTIQNNQATGAGGGGVLVNDARAVMRMTGGTISHNTVTSLCVFSGGGGIRLNHGIVTIDAGTISNNTARRQGGGVRVMTGEVGAFTMRGGTVSNNRAQEGDGGGIFADRHTYASPLPAGRHYPSLNIGANVRFLGNTASRGGVMPPSNATTATNIARTATRSGRFAHPLNNLDINFRER